MTTPDQSHREKELFEHALEILAPDERSAFLDKACVGDLPLRQRLEDLLRAHREAGDFLPDHSGTNCPGADVIATDLSNPSERPGDLIGGYKLLEKIGEGGCGTVYMAAQEKPLRRRVALKVIKPGMDSKSVIARFEAERQALALMDHPHIAKVLDAGCTESGRPFFVMELVKGIKITDYCDQNNLALPARLKLYIQVCQAIQHAHQKGVIHRDIKPSNILVTLYDGEPVPKVIDFGIAKATQQPLTDKTLFTAFDQFVGTPAYMSPEQAAMSSLEIDPRSDVYSLGVLLYELLTGKTPFETKNLVRAGLDEIRRIIREEEPARPSTRVSTMAAADLSQVAIQRQARPADLSSVLHGDLDWIVMKALEKNRQRRYDTAYGLAEDIQRYLGNQTVLARPPSVVYRFQKMVRRNRTTFAVIVGMAVTLVGVTLFGLIKVVPVLAENPALQGRPLPAGVQFVLDLSHFLGRWFLLIFILVAGGGYVFWKLRRRRASEFQRC